MKENFSEEHQHVLTWLEEGTGHALVLGRAGTGKSTLLKHFRENTKRFVVVLAPTGVAALNVEGETIHSFFGFGPGVTTEFAEREAKRNRGDQVYDTVDTIIIDEISMVRADLLDCVDAFLRIVRKSKEMFGGVRMVFIGDLMQLPPVLTSAERPVFLSRYETPYFFSADSYRIIVAKEDVSAFVLTTVYRQTDPVFLALLEEIRNGRVTQSVLDALRDRVRPKTELQGRVLALTATVARAEELNTRALSGLAGEEIRFEGRTQGHFSERDAPADPVLILKKNARVMFVVNDSNDRWVNGTIGTVVSFLDDVLRVQIDDGKTVDVTPFTWSAYKTVFDEKKRSLSQERTGSYTQLPLKLAWAVTIHKSQGKTFNAAFIDFERGAFAPGQAYVALSRVKTLDGVFLARALLQHDVRVDPIIRSFLSAMHPAAPAATESDEMLRVLQDACARRELLSIVYKKSEDEQRERVVKPFRVEERAGEPGKRLVLLGQCMETNAFRLFYLHKMLSLRPVSPLR